jgi:hypothetical protein
MSDGRFGLREKIQTKIPLFSGIFHAVGFGYIILPLTRISFSRKVAQMNERI